VYLPGSKASDSLTVVSPVDHTNNSIGVRQPEEPYSVLPPVDTVLCAERHRSLERKGHRVTHDSASVSSECRDADLVRYGQEASPMVDVVRTGIANPESQVCSELRLVGEP
jgi:hypothetical protein